MKNRKSAITIIAILSAMHFMTDFICAFAVYSRIKEGRLVDVVLYNFCAFVLQMPLGLLADVLKMKRQEDRIDPVRSTFGQIEREKVNARDVMHTVRRRIRRKGKCTFRSLLMARPGRDYVVVTFLTVLELMKLGRVDAVQEDLFGEIYITVKDPDDWDDDYSDPDMFL